VKTARTLAATAPTRVARRSNSSGTEKAEMQNTIRASTPPIRLVKKWKRNVPSGSKACCPAPPIMKL
jgi:hypothetical protein